MQRTLLFIVLLTVLAVAFGYNYFFQPFKNLEWGQPPLAQVTPTPEPEALTSEDVLFESLTPHDRLAQLFVFPLTWPNDVASDSASLAWIRDHRPGFVTLFGNGLTAEETTQLIQEIRAPYDATLSAMIMVDHEGGVVQRLNGEGFTKLPSWHTLCSQDASSSAALLRQSAGEVKQVGVDIVLAPVVDVGGSTTPLTSRICSDDPQVVSDRAGEWVTIFQQVGLIPVLKHFPGLGSTQRDLHFAFDRVTVTEKDTQPYLDILGTHPTIGVLTAHVGVTNQDPDVPCSLSRNCVGQIVENYPQVLVISDDVLSMTSAGYQAGTTELKPELQRVIETIQAGNDLMAFGKDVKADTLSTLISDLEKTYHESPTFRAQVDKSVKKVIHMKATQR